MKRRLLWITLFLSLPALAQTSVTTPFVEIPKDSFDGQVTQLALDWFNHAPHIISALNARACPNDPLNSPPNVKCYACEYEAAKDSLPQTDPKKKSPLQEKTYTASIFTVNDNVLLGMVSNDTGYTYASGVSISRKFDHGTATFTAQSSLFTEIKKYDYSGWGKAYDMKSKGLIDSIVYVDRGGGIAQNFVDSESFKLNYVTNGPVFTDVTLGYDRRSTTEEHGKPFADATQDFWHRKVLGIYYYDGSLTDYAGSFVTKGNTAYITNGEKTDPRFKEVAKNSFQVSVSEGLRKDILGGKCKLKAEIGLSLATEGKQIVGPNSTVNASADARAVLFKTKAGDPRIKMGIGGAIFYYPTTYSGDEGTRLGATVTTDVESIHKVGKKGNTLSPFIAFYLPYGRQQFNFTNPDQGKEGLINTFGVRYNFGK